jgi:hypothetical protein
MHQYFRHPKNYEKSEEEIFERHRKNGKNESLNGK